MATAMVTQAEPAMEAVTNDTCTTILSNPLARHDVQADLYDRVSIIPGRLDYGLIPSASYSRISSTYAAPPPAATPLPIVQGEEPDTLYVTVDDHLVYARFFADFGPLNLSQTVLFCRAMTSHLSTFKHVLLISSNHPHKRANVITLLALFLVVAYQKTPQQAVAWCRSLRPAQGFRDAACGLSSFFLTVFDCVCAVHKAIRASIFDYATFRLDEYEYYDKLYHGDINWIVPGKLLAFSGPQRDRIALDTNGRTTLLASDYAKVFTTLGVSCVVRFNEPTTYDRRAFIQASIRHLDMEYPDGGNPPDEILFKFIRTCERESGAIAVHCKAGLGRTGTNIAAYLMKIHRFTAIEAIAWCRICRPGSIVGPQQQFLVVKQPQLWKMGTDQEEKQSQPKESATIKRQSFAAVRERLPSAQSTLHGTPKQPLRREASISSRGRLVVATTASRKLPPALR